MGDKEVGPWLGDGSNRSVWVRPAALAHQHSACETVSCYGARGSDAGSPRSGERAGARAGKHLCDVAEKAGGSPKVSAPKADLESLPPAAQRASCAGIQLCRDPAVGGSSHPQAPAVQGSSCAALQLCTALAAWDRGWTCLQLFGAPPQTSPAVHGSSCAGPQLRASLHCVSEPCPPAAAIPAVHIAAVQRPGRAALCSGPGPRQMELYSCAGSCAPAGWVLQRAEPRVVGTHGSPGTALWPCRRHRLKCARSVAVTPSSGQPVSPEIAARGTLKLQHAAPQRVPGCTPNRNRVRPEARCDGWPERGRALGPSQAARQEGGKGKGRNKNKTISHNQNPLLGPI